MSIVTHIEQYGNQLAVLFDDGTRRLAYPTVGGLWLLAAYEDPTPEPPEPGEGLYNPWANQAETGSWFNHASYSAGGVDYDPGDGSPILAPGNGSIYITGNPVGPFEYEASTTVSGGAGRRTVLMLDQEYTRKQPAESPPPEGGGTLKAIVFQHMSSQRAAGPILRGQSLGVIGGSGLGSENGYAVHIHVHGLNAAGQRVDFRKFI